MKQYYPILLSILFFSLSGFSQTVSLIGPATVLESAGVQTYTVTLSAAQAYSVTVNYQSYDGSALAGLDYTSVSGILTFTPGQTSKTIPVIILNDFLNETQEYYYVQLSNAQNASNSQSIPFTVSFAYGYIDNDDPSLSIAAPANVEEAAGTQTFNVTLSAAATYSVSVNYQTYNGSALAGSDFTSFSGTLTFAPGQTTKTINVPIVNDFMNESTEYYYIELSNALNATNPSPMTISNTYAYAYIDDNDPTVSINVASTPATILESGGNQSFTATLSAAQTYSVSVSYQALSYSAAAGTDFVNTSGTLTFAPGQVTKTILVPIIDDYLNENQELYLVELTNPQNVNTAMPMVLSNTYGYGYIDDNDPVISISNAPSPATIEESGGNQTFTVTLSAPQTYSVSVSYQSVDVSATSGNDFVSQIGTLTFAPGQTIKTIVVPVLNDFLNEYQEYYYIQLSNAMNLNNAQPMSLYNTYSYGYINDDDPILSISNAATPPTVIESGGSQAFTVTLSAPTTYSVSVQYQSFDGSATAGSDFTTVSGTLVFSPGQTSKTITVPILDDNTFEYLEYYYISITNALNVNNSASMSLSGTFSYGYIDDDDATLSISNPTPVSVTEAAGASQVFTVTLSAAPSFPVSVQYQTQPASATAGSDYTHVSGTLLFTPGQLTKTITVPILNDYLNESQEYYYIQLSNALNTTNSQPMTIITSNAYGTIDDDDPSLSISYPNPATITETPGAIQTYTVTLTAPQTYSVSVNYQTDNGSAVAGSDFTSVSGTLVFAPGQTSKQINVPISNDFMYEFLEYYSVSLSNAQHTGNASPMTITGANGYGYIDDIDPVVSIGLASPDSITESWTATQTFTVSLSAPQTYPITVAYQTNGASATEGIDYVAASGTLTFAAGETSKVITVSLLDDYINEYPEYYYVSIANAKHGGNSLPVYIGSSYYSYAYIKDNDPTISILAPSPLAVNENAGTQLFTVTLSAPQTYPAAVDYTLYGSSAQAGTDFTFGTCALTLTFAPGETTKVFTASIIDDGITESTESYYAQLSNPRNVNMNMPMTILTSYMYTDILDNDNAGCGSNVLNKPVITGSTLYCPNTNLQLSVAPVAGAIGYVWKGPNGFTASGQTININNVTSVHSGIYTARAYRAGGTVCDTSVGANVNVSVLPCASTVSLKLYIEGYYVDSGRMTTVLLNHGQSASTTLTDSIDVELHQSVSPYGLISTIRVALNTNGTAIATFPSVNGSYYVAIKHHNALQTWSATPVLIGPSPVSYDFSNASSKAYGSNMKQVQPGIWALYSGDLNQDENIDLLDVSMLEDRINSFDNCFLPADINGDANTDLLDSPIVEDNTSLFIYTIRP